MYKGEYIKSQMPGYYIERENQMMNEYGFEFFCDMRNLGAMVISHGHPSVEFLYIEEGSFSVRVDNKTFSANPQDLIIIRSNTIHSIALNEPREGTYWVLKVNPNIIFNMFSSKSDMNLALTFLQTRDEDKVAIFANEMPSDVLDSLNKLISMGADNGSAALISKRIYALEFLLNLCLTLPSSSEPGKKNISSQAISLVYEGVAYINENYAQDITPHECAEKIHVSYSYFARLFRAVTGKTFKQYLTGVRLAAAHNMLITEDKMVTDVALSTGYTNVSYFISEYKKVYGKTPRSTYNSLRSDK